MNNRFYKNASWWARTFYKPKKLIQVDSIKEIEYNPSPTYKIGDCLLVPMKSGKKAIIRVYAIWTPSNPGDQHFYRYEFIRYKK